MNSTLLVVAVQLLPMAVLAAEPAEETRVRLDGFHACCGRCVTALTEALERVEGVDDVSADKKTRHCEFRVRDERTVERALEAVRHAGFAGRVKVDGVARPMPCDPLPSELVADQIRFSGVHLCCKGCAVAVAHAFEDLERVTAVDCDVETGTVTLLGDAMPVKTMRRALYSAGFAGRVVR